MVTGNSLPQRYFYPRPPRGGRPAAGGLPWPCFAISIHALREEGDVIFSRDKYLSLLFLSTPSARRATQYLPARLQSKEISIHALREEGDAFFVCLGVLHKDFYPRPPRGGRQRIPLEEKQPARFLSTPSARRATVSWTPLSSMGINFYPRPPRGGRPNLQRYGRANRIFLSTPSARRATCQCSESGRRHHISIHALREEGDLYAMLAFAEIWLFLSTPSARRATTCILPSATRWPNFYPRPPRGGRQQKQRKNPCFYSIINHSAQNGKSCNCAEHERCVFCGQNIRFSGAKKTEKA